MSDICEKSSAKEIHEKELKKANDLYIYTLILSGAIILAGIVYAVAVKVFIGLLIAMAGALTYVALTSNILYRVMGLSYKSESGKLTLTNVYGRDREDIYIPKRLILCRVVEIDDKAFSHKSSENIKRVYLPASIEKIGENIFEGCPNLEQIYFAGSQESWNKIESLTDTSSYEIVFGEAEE